jgi:hypothetical protein
MSIQERWQETFEKVGRSCPAQRADESNLGYQKRLARIGRRYIPEGEEIARVRFDNSLPDEYVPKMSEMMRAAVERNVYRTDNMRSGELRAVQHIDAGGTRTTRFIGPDSFVKAMTLPARRVVRINKPVVETLYNSAKAAMSGIW